MKITNVVEKSLLSALLKQREYIEYNILNILF